MPISVAEPWHIWLQHPELVERVDFIAVHLLPYWEGLPVDAAVAYVLKRYRELQATYPDKPIVIGEVGWPSNGRQRGGAVPSLSNQAKFLKRFMALADQEGWDYFLIEAFDQPWKAETEGGVGAYWGLYDVERNPKFSFTQPVLDIPQWKLLAGLSVVFAILLLGPLLRGDNILSSVGRTFLALVTFGAVTAVVWLIYSYTKQYLTWSSIILGMIMLLGILGLIMVLLAEAHEWAEALWIKQPRRTWKPQPVADSQLPFVSIHIPAYSEPPDMLKETLDALAAMDYPHYEVLVIDNNTQDPALWKPVKAHCKALGERFRFFHFDKLAGFKAGAMNVALRETSPLAEIIAAIDSDYIVEPNWLRDLTPAFSDPQLGIMQAPQDYRDGNENLFKAMCNAEYRGFFQIGMVTRNERNAIIQHGTMTMIRKSVLEEVGGWSEWCITEDAELGLRVFEQGYTAQYVPVSYGRGLIPDNFLDFKKQRFRWAYGAVMIMRRHFAELMGFKPTHLTRGQRYHFIAGWLPWISDGLSLIINLAALVWTVGMVVSPERFDPPLLMFALFPLALFAFKIIKLSFLYHLRVKASLRQSLGAAIAGLALAHAISRAIVSGFTNSNIGFFRTPKMARHSAFLQAFHHAREEFLIMVALWLGAWAVWQVHGHELLDINVWVTMLLVQSIPYSAAVLMSLISALPRLPASLIGSLQRLGESSQSESSPTA
jgi:cellulose synthase/poly-beta-1,6-N-acetylglucosamine synthase-like glycosyltransferase